VASGHKLTSDAASGHKFASSLVFGHKFASGAAFGHNMASGPAFGHNFSSGAASGPDIASGPAFGHNFASGAASGQNLAFGCNELFQLITAFGQVKLIGHVGHTNGLVNHNSQIQPQLIVVIAKDFKIYLFFQDYCRIFCKGVKDHCNGLIRDGGVGYTGIDDSLVKPILIVRINGLDGHTGPNGLIGLVGFCIIDLITLLALSKHWLNGLVDFLGCKTLVGIFSLVGLGFVGLNCLVGIVLCHISLIGLVGLIGFIGLVGLVGFGLNGLIGKGIIVNSLQFEIEMKQSQHDLFWRESWLWCVRRVFFSLAGLDSVFRNALQNATQLFFDRIPQMTKYCIMRECENIHSWIFLSGDLVFSHQQGIYGFKFPKSVLEIFSRDLTLFSILII
jgi:hypothetical protein